ncbi:type VI secretion system amidase effector protein Tae4 [Desulfovibrio litoralis]|uniref:Type VI secretion system (T6SS), amidase effector protein 4 n=1 Tax=Desulfovibrio litoralis DSM 11393 TaxID=1121455 RepID=A0A1M7SPS9_9BACT|nr:type VI secretion system amidase effector protein Tae4 [Desulfovibrio litoralis]SHN60420.1 Type VI secretion system (T6SS), amidase effector protein 4 [Desulfovibrio litoralis DSM 11393]
MPNIPSKAATNNIPQSHKKEPLKVITFKELWSAYPEAAPCNKPSDGSLWDEIFGTNPAFDNQCAIRLSVCLQHAGASLKTFKGVTCNYHKDEKHVLRAKELAEWLDKRYLANWPKSINITSKDWRSKITNKTGVVYFANYWIPEGSKFPTGGHIDLWNGSRFPHYSFRSFATNVGRFNIDSPDLFYSNLDNATTILFWEIP